MLDWNISNIISRLRESEFRVISGLVEKTLREDNGTHSSTLAWKIPWTEEPGGLQSMGLLRVGHDWETSLSCIGEGNGNPLQCSCLENPRDGGAWWAAIYGVAQSRTWLKWLSSSSSSSQRIGASASTSVLPMNTQGWFPLGFTGLISLLSKGFSRVFSSTTIWKHQFFSAQPSLWSNSHICAWLLEKHSFDYMDLCQKSNKVPSTQKLSCGEKWYECLTLS